MMNSATEIDKQTILVGLLISETSPSKSNAAAKAKVDQVSLVVIDSKNIKECSILARNISKGVVYPQSFCNTHSKLGFEI